MLKYLLKQNFKEIALWKKIKISEKKILHNFSLKVLGNVLKKGNLIAKNVFNISLKKDFFNELYYDKLYYNFKF